MSERYERTDERVARYVRRDSWLFRTTASMRQRNITHQCHPFHHGFKPPFATNQTNSIINTIFLISTTTTVIPLFWQIWVTRRSIHIVDFEIALVNPDLKLCM